MEPLTILRADPLDLLFENRNKAYGAYPLRKYYAQRLMVSLGIVITFLCIVTFLYFRFRSQVIISYMADIPGIVLTPIDPLLPPKPMDPRSRPVAPKPPAILRFVTPVIVNDPPPSTVMAGVKDLDNQVIGLQTAAGEAGADGEPADKNAKGTAAGSSDSTEGSKEIFEHPEQMPEFPGGPEALKRFLQKNLHMPENNLETGTRVKVIARFVVDAEGRVGNVEITQAADEMFNREVSRVISKMPEWKPGKQHNRNVAVYFSLPVNFVAEE